MNITYNVIRRIGGRKRMGFFHLQKSVEFIIFL